MSVYSNEGVKISIGGAVAPSASPDQATYAAATYNAIGEVKDIGEFGDQTEIVEWLTLGDGRKRKVKGTKDAGNIVLTVGRDPIDVGQVALRTASGVSDPRMFKVELSDKPAAGASPKNTVIYFAALVTSGRNVIGGANSVTEQNFELALTTGLTEVVASGA